MIDSLVTSPGTYDPIMLEAQWRRLISIVDQVDTATIRTSFSTIVGESHDFGCVLMDQDGWGLAQAQWSPPGFCTRLPRTTRAMLEKYPKAGLRPGDVLITNDPWLASGHLPDYKLVTPVFHRGEIVAFFGTAAHVSDVGGARGDLDQADVFEEGIRILPTYFYRDGVPVEVLHEIISANCRVPDLVMGDLHAIVGTHKVGAQRLVEFLEDYDLADLRALAAEILDRSEQALRAAIAALPDGTYGYELMVDGYIDPVLLKLRIDIRGSEMYMDYAGTSPQVRNRAINSTFNMTYANTIYPIKCMLVPAIPNNNGLVRPLHISAPEGSILNCRFPAPVKSRQKVGNHIPYLVFGALAPLLPAETIAAASGIYPIRFFGHEERFGTFSVAVFGHGGLGATGASDGWMPAAFPHNSTVTPAEILEQRCPVLMLKKALIPDSGGPGRTRGGLGQEFVFRCVANEPITLSIRPDRVFFPAPGLEGGLPGQRAEAFFNGVRVERFGPLEFRAGDEYVLRMAGGGGFGVPEERDPAAVRQDLALGLITRKQAEQVYDYGGP